MGGMLDACLGDQNRDKNSEVRLVGGTKGGNYATEDTTRRILSFKDFKGFKKTENIKLKYTIGDLLG
jgi:hypothetical protein